MILEQIDYPRLLSDPNVITRVTYMRSERGKQTLQQISILIHEMWDKLGQTLLKTDNEPMDEDSLWELGMEKRCTFGSPYGLKTRRQIAHSTPWFQPNETLAGTVSVYCLNQVCRSAIENKYSMENKVIALRQIILLLILGAFRIKFGEVIESILYRLDINSKVALMRLPLIHISPQLIETLNVWEAL